jgi:hypothetical protein
VSKRNPPRNENVFIGSAFVGSRQCISAVTFRREISAFWYSNYHHSVTSCDIPILHAHSQTERNGTTTHAGVCFYFGALERIILGSKETIFHSTTIVNLIIIRQVLTAFPTHEIVKARALAAAVVLVSHNNVRERRKKNY